jgi:hypothetical protein
MKSAGSERRRGSAAHSPHPPEHHAPTRAVRLLFTGVALVMLLTPVASRQLTAIHVSAGDDLQAAINAAKPGDQILLAPGARFVGSFVLPARGDMPAFITIRTDADGLPGPGVRTGPEHSGTLAVLQSGTNSPALRTAAGAHHWRVENVEFRANKGGYGDIIALGQGGREQSRRDDVPYAIVIDRVYVHGDPLTGQKRGIALNSAATEILNSYVADIKAVGQDSQAIAGWNGPGPFVLANNYLEAAGENVMFGGGDPAIEGLVPQDITIRRNHITRPTSWRDPIVAVPADVAATAGSPAAPAPEAAASAPTTEPQARSYRVVAERAVSSGQRAFSAATDPIRVDAAGDATVALRWTAVPGASGYRVYRRDAAGEQWWPAAEAAFTDAGTPGKPGAPPKNATRWSVKNLLELKNARNVEIDGNTIEYNWAAAQDGYAILFKPVNQDGGAPWVTIENVRFTNNVVRHVAAAINVNGADTDHPSTRARGIVIRNNLFDDVSGAHWGGPGDFIKIGNGPADLVVERNTVVNDGRIINVYGGKGGEKVEGFAFRGNVVRHNKYGVKGQGAGIGRPTLERYFPGGVFEGNVVGDTRRSPYPDGNRVVADADIQIGATYAGAGVDMGPLDAAIGGHTSATGAPATPRPGSN